MRLAATVKWYEMGKISQSKASELNGLSRQEFLDALYRFDVSPFQVTSSKRNCLMPEKGVVDASPIIPLLKKLEKVGFRINRNLYDAAVELAGEKRS